jgi:hypothetical protein
MHQRGADAYRGQVAALMARVLAGVATELHGLINTTFAAATCRVISERFSLASGATPPR